VLRLRFNASMDENGPWESLVAIWVKKSLPVSRRSNLGLVFRFSQSAIALSLHRLAVASLRFDLEEQYVQSRFSLSISSACPWCRYLYDFVRKPRDIRVLG
jgi:hypothetical protein